MNTLEDIFLHTKPAKMLVKLKRGDANYASALSREVDCTYSHTVKVLDRFKEHGLVTFNKAGRKKLIELTEDGRELADHMDNVISSINGSRKQ